MTQQKLQDNVNWLLLRVSMLVKQELMRISEEQGLTIMQAFTLCLLEPGQTVQMNSVSGLLGCDPSNVTGIVDKLVHDGLIDRKESSVDRRVKAIGLTDKGLQLRKTFLTKIINSDSKNLINLSDVEVEQLKALLIKSMSPRP